MKSIRRMSQAELAAYVHDHLRKEGITVVLSGGAAVSIYSVNRYVSADVDLVNVYSVARSRIRASMQEIGFHEKNRYFSHPDSKQLVEFPPGPLAIGDQAVTDITEMKLATGSLRIISPTDCVKDRLAAYYYWDDQQSLAQAILVATRRAVNLSEIKRWSQASGMTSKFNVFRTQLSSKTRKK